MSSLSPRGDMFVRETQINTEKAAAQFSQNPDECYNIYDEGHGDLQVFTVADATDVKLAKDGKTVLIPQPSDDPEDVLNWTPGKKYRVLLSLIFASMVLFEAQAQEWHMSVHDVAASVSGGIFLQGPGGLLAVPLIQRFGRLPVLFWSQLLTALVVMAAAVSPNYACFTAFRTLQGFVNTAPQVIGLSMVHDLFFFHERVRYTNLWVLFLVGTLYLGPFFAAWLSQVVSWRANFGILAGLHGFATLLIIALGDETLYDRGNPQHKQHGILAQLKLLIGIAGCKAHGRPSPVRVIKDLFLVQIKPQVFFVTVIYVMLLVAWNIGVVATISQLVLPPPYSFSHSALALTWLAPTIGAVMGAFWGDWFNSWLQARYIRSHAGVYVLENRLWGTYAPTLVSFTGLILFGQTLEHSMHWIGLLIGWAFLAFAVVSATTAVSAYCLDCFPNHASLIAAIVNMWRTTAGFCVTYFQLKWIAATGPGVSFGCQAAIIASAFVCGVVTTQVWGKKWRLKYPPPAVGK